MGMAEAKGERMATEDSGPELEPQRQMKPQYLRCNKGHVDVWYADEEGVECPLCEVASRGWAKPVRKP
jgi:hypothetical protein